MNSRKNNSLPVLSSYKKVVERKYKTERLIAAKCNNLKMFVGKWKPFSNCSVIYNRSVRKNRIVQVV